MGEKIKDFSKASFTAIISDLHLCEAEAPHPHFDLWKKYKTRQFFYDEKFSGFLKRIVEMAGGSEVELILNGDIFDFDSICALPEDPSFRISWLEKLRGLGPEEDKSVFKMTRILDDHAEWVDALRWFLKCGHRVVFVIGNHDLELHWPGVQKLIIDRLGLEEPYRENLRFCEWFYISNGDTLIEHGNQLDPYCLCFDPVDPYVLQYNKVEIRLPFGNLACRYLINGMGFFNPHNDANYVMSLSEYVAFFIRYMLRAQPLIIWTWFWGSAMAGIQSFTDSLLPPLRDPLRIEDQIEAVAAKANATPRIARELKALFARPAARKPFLIAQELWLDRAFIVLIALLGLFYLFSFIKNVYDLSFFWIFIPLLLLVPFFLFYSRSIRSQVTYYKEPQDHILSMQAAIAKVSRIVYGHTHVVRHEVIGAVEHLNPGSWSPAFYDVECTKPLGEKTFIWIQPDAEGNREARIHYVQERSVASRQLSDDVPQQPRRKVAEG